MVADFYHKDGGDMFLRNVGSHKIYTAPHPRTRHSNIKMYLSEMNWVDLAQDRDQWWDLVNIIMNLRVP
jgi:hypothetical protein